MEAVVVVVARCLAAAADDDDELEASEGDPAALAVGKLGRLHRRTLKREKPENSFQ